MSGEKSNQLLQEQESWKRSLEFFRQENALLKYRLSEMVDTTEGSDFLQMAEYFHNEFLLKDEWLKRLLLSLQSIQDTILLAPQNGDGEHAENLQDELREQICQFENTFFTLAANFNQKILQFAS